MAEVVPMEGIRMYQHILIPTDGSKLAHKAVVHGLSLAKAVGARITALTVQPSFTSDRFAEYAKQSSAEAASVLNEIADAAKAAGVQCETMQVTHNQPHEAIVAVAKDKACDVIVMASHGRSGIVSILLGSVTAKVLAHATVPVVVYR
jgi:nucleotide-binding universal stress UspA family protein